MKKLFIALLLIPALAFAEYKRNPYTKQLDYYEAGVSDQDHSTLSNLSYAASGHTGFEPTVTKGNLTAASPLSFSVASQVIGNTTEISIPPADASNDGYMTSDDHNALFGLYRLYGKKYGMVCNGVTDDTAAFQDLIDDCSGCHAYIPHGVCMVDEITLHSGMIGSVVEGIGNSDNPSFYGTILKARTASQNSIFRAPAGVSQVEFEKILLDLDNIGKCGVDGSGATRNDLGASGLHFHNMSIRNFTEYGLYLMGGNMSGDNLRIYTSTTNAGAVGMHVYSDSAFWNVETSNGSIPLVVASGGNTFYGLWANSGYTAQVKVAPFDASTPVNNNSFYGAYVGETNNNAEAPIVWLVGTAANKIHNFNWNGYTVSAGGLFSGQTSKYNTHFKIEYGGYGINIDNRFEGTTPCTAAICDKYKVYAENTTQLTLNGQSKGGKNFLYSGSGNQSIKVDIDITDWATDASQVSGTEGAAFVITDSSTLFNIKGNLQTTSVSTAPYAAEIANCDTGTIDTIYRYNSATWVNCGSGNLHGSKHLFGGPKYDFSNFYGLAGVGEIYTALDDTYFQNLTADKDFIFRGNVGGTPYQEIMRIDVSANKVQAPHLGASGNFDVSGTTTLNTSLSGIAKLTSGVVSAITDNSSNWDTAYGWGDHSSAGYFIKASDTLDDIADGSTYVKISTTSKDNYDAAYTHVSNNGTDHSYIDQDVTTTGTPSFAEVTASTFTVSNDGIITTSSDGLIVKNQTQDKDIIFSINDGGVDTNVLTLQGSSGYVGIGTTSPTENLDIAGAADNVDFRVTTYSDTNTHRSRFFFFKSHSDTLGTLAETQDGEDLGRFQASGVNSSGAQAAGSAQINFVQDGAAGADFVPAKITFNTGTAAAGATSLPRFEIASDGGIYTFDLLGGAIGANPQVWYDTTTKELAYDTSAFKYKENIRDLTDTAWIYNLRPVVFDEKKGNRKNMAGLIAEEVEKVNPEMVFYKDGKVEGVAYNQLIPYLLKEVQKLRREVDMLKGLPHNKPICGGVFCP